MRRLLVVLVVVVGLLVVVDRVAVAVAERAVAERIQTDQHLDRRPDVSIRGFPFLTQLVGGTYDDVTVDARDLTAARLQVADLTVDLHGARVPLHAVLHQNVQRVPVDRATARLLLSYDDLDALLGTDHLSLSAGSHGDVHVTASGAGLSVDTDVPVAVRSDTLHLSVGGGDVTIPLGGLPFGLRLTRAEATGDGIVVVGSAQGLVVPT